MKKQLFTIVIVLTVLFSACNKHEEANHDQQESILVEKANPESIPQGNPLDKLKLDQVIISSLKSKNDFQ